MIRIVCSCGHTIDPVAEKKSYLEFHLGEYKIYYMCEKCSKKYSIDLKQELKPYPKIKGLK